MDVTPGMPLDELDTPAVLVDLDRLERNLAGMAALTDRCGVALRPHTKTHKTTWIAAEQVRHGARGLTVAKLGEAEVMADAGFDDLLVAFPIVGSHKLRRLAALRERAAVSIATDDAVVAEGVAPLGNGASGAVDVYVEIDSGQHRAGAQPGSAGADVAERIARIDGVRLVGLMTHGGHSYGQTDAEGRRRIALDEARALAETAEVLERRGIGGLRLSLGATPAAEFLPDVVAAYPTISEARYGAYVFGDANHLATGVTTEDRSALTVLATIVSRPAPDRAVADAGSKTLGGDGPGAGNTGFGRVLGESRATIERLSEEHAWIGIDPSVPWRIGDRVRLIPNHGCVVPNLADQLVGIRGEVVERVIPVEGRGRNT